MSNRIITISRQYGSGGHEIAEELSRQLGIPYYDQDIIAEVAVKTGYDKEFVSEQGENVENSGWWHSLTSRSRFESNPQDIIWNVTEKVIREMAAKESCIIIGRGGDYILDGQNTLKVFVMAKMEDRLNRVRTEYGNANATVELLQKMDKKRSSFYKYYTDMTWGAAPNYDLCLNTSMIGIKRSIEMIKEFY